MAIMRLILLLSFVCVSGLFLEDNAPAPPAIGSTVSDFTFKDINGRHQSLSGYKNKKATIVIFVGTECPIANLYYPTLKAMYEKYAEKGVGFLAINSNDQDSSARVAGHARERELPFPVLKDIDHQAADALGASRTPEAFLLDSAKVIRYRGRIDDQYGYSYRRAAPTRTELKDAIEELLAGKPITTSQSEVQGCVIGRGKRPNNPMR
jgi:peroxiredoxin